MRIADLTRTLKSNTTVYIVGTGPSLRCMALDFLEDKISIGLNQAWRHFKPTLSLTVHPELLQDYETTKTKPVTQWVVKRKPPRGDLTFDDPKYYVFDTSYEIACVVKRPEHTLYLGEGAQTTAMDLAARMGARHIVLVGCDAKTLGGDFHAHDQHVKFLGMTPADQYKLYRQTTAAVRRKLRPEGVTVSTLSPFIGIDAGEEDYQRLCEELNLSKLPVPQDTSTYIRDPKTIRTGQ